VDIRARLGRNVRKLREEKGWSQEDYADRAGIHRTYVSDIERGRRNPTITVVEKLAMPFQLSASELIR
jgi:transcriptional regulator with XRE-family HTH domain